MKDIPDEIRTEMDREQSPVPLLDEKSRLEAEFQTLLVVVASLRSETTFSRAEDIWIQLLTKEVYYKRMQYLNNFSLRFLTRTFNECTVEAQVSTININEIETSKRRLSCTTSERLTFIATNRPHPLQCLKVVEDALDKHFENKPWHFVMCGTKYFASKVVDRQVKDSYEFTNDF